MARGINDNWKQPLGYFFLKSTIKAEDLEGILYNCLKKLEEAGAVVKLVVSDMGSNFVQLSKKLGITIEQTSFQVEKSYIFLVLIYPVYISLILLPGQWKESVLPV